MYVGMRLLLYSKECVRLRLMNGTLCELVDIVFADEEALPSSEFAGEPILLEFLPVQLLLRAVDAERVLPRPHPEVLQALREQYAAANRLAN